jgi:hypothetical protein
LAYCVRELLEAELAPGQIRPKAALALETVAIPASAVYAFPELLARFDVALSGKDVGLKQGKQEN